MGKSVVGSGAALCALAAALAATAIPAAAQHGTMTHGHVAASHAKITASQARSSALKKYPGRVEGKVALENEDGKWQYSVNVRSGKTLREVMVDASTGKIASVEVTTKAEEAREAAAEAKTKPHKAPAKSSSATHKK